MKTTFRIINKEFADYFKITVNSQTKYFRDETIFEYDDCDSLLVEIERVSPNEYMNKEVTNTFLRFLINIPIAVIEVLLSMLVFFADADSSYGLKAEEVFSNFSPFKLKKCYSISNPDNKAIELKLVNFQFNKLIKKYSEPDIIVNDDSVFCTDSEVTYCEKCSKHNGNFTLFLHFA